MNCNIKLRIYQLGDDKSPYIDIQVGNKKIADDYLHIAEAISKADIKFISDEKINPDLLENGKITRNTISLLLRKSFAQPIDIDEMFRNGTGVVHTHTLDELIKQHNTIPLKDSEKIKVLVTNKYSSQFNNKILSQDGEDIYVINNTSASVISLSNFINDIRNIKIECSSDESDLYKQGLEHLNTFVKVNKDILDELKKYDENFFNKVKNGISYLNMYNYISSLKEEYSEKIIDAETISSEIKSLKTKIENEQDEEVKKNLKKDLKEKEDRKKELGTSKLKGLIRNLTFYLEMYDIQTPFDLYNKFLTKKKIFDSKPYDSLKDEIQKSIDIYNGTQNEFHYDDLFTEHVLSKAKYIGTKDYSRSEYVMSLKDLQKNFSNLRNILSFEKADLEKKKLDTTKIDKDIIKYSEIITAINTINNSDSTKDEVNGARETLYEKINDILILPTTELDYSLPLIESETDEEENKRRSYKRAIFKDKDGFNIRFYTNAGNLEERYHMTVDTYEIPKICDLPKGGFNIYSIVKSGNTYYFTCKGRWTPTTNVRLFPKIEFAEKYRDNSIYKQTTLNHDLVLNTSKSSSVIFETSNRYEEGTIITAYDYSPTEEEINAISDPNNAFHRFMFGAITVSQALSFIKKPTILSDITVENSKDFNIWFKSKEIDVEILKLFSYKLATISIPMTIATFKEAYEDFANSVITSENLKSFIITDVAKKEEGGYNRIVANQISKNSTNNNTSQSEDLYGAFSEFAKEMKKRLGVNVELISKPDKTIKAGAKAWIEGDTIYINVNDASLSDGFHEYCHLLLGYFKIQLENEQNKKPEDREIEFTYEEFLEKFASTKGIEKKLEAKQQLYPNRSKYDILEEIFCDEFGRAILSASGNFNSIEDFFNQVVLKFKLNGNGEIFNEKPAIASVFVDGLSKINEDVSKTYSSQFVKAFTKFINKKYGFQEKKIWEDKEVMNSLQKERRIRNFIEDNLSASDEDFNSADVSIKEECE